MYCPISSLTQIVKATLEDASKLNLFQARSLTELSVSEIPPQFVPLLLVWSQLRPPQLKANMSLIAWSTTFFFLFLIMILFFILLAWSLQLGPPQAMPGSDQICLSTPDQRSRETDTLNDRPARPRSKRYLLVINTNHNIFLENVLR